MQFNLRDNLLSYEHPEKELNKAQQATLYIKHLAESAIFEVSSFNENS